MTVVVPPTDQMSFVAGAEMASRTLVILTEGGVATCRHAVPFQWARRVRSWPPLTG